MKYVKRCLSFVSFLILIQSEFYLSAAVTKRNQCKQQDVRQIVGNCLPYVPSRARRSEKNRQATEEECYSREIELENEGDNED